MNGFEVLREAFLWWFRRGKVIAAEEEGGNGEEDLRLVHACCGFCDKDAHV